MSMNPWILRMNVINYYDVINMYEFDDDNTFDKPCLFMWSASLENFKL